MKSRIHIGLLVSSVLAFSGIAKADTNVSDARRASTFEHRGRFYIGGALGVSGTDAKGVLGGTPSTQSMFHTAASSNGSSSFDVSKVGGNSEFRAGYEFKRDKLYLAGDVFTQKLFANEANILYAAGSANEVTSMAVNYLYGLKAKAGYNVSKRVSAYAIAGVARAHSNISATNSTSGAYGNTEVSDVGLVYGVGLSYQVGPRVSLTAEYQAVRFVDGKVARAGVSPGALSFKDINIQSFMVGANFLF